MPNLDTIGEAFIDIRVNLDKLQTELAKAETEVKTKATQMEKAFTAIGSGISTAFGAVRSMVPAVTAVGAALAVATKKALDFASELVDTSRNLGISTTALQELRFAAQQSGVSVQSLNTALGLLAKNQGEASDVNSQAADAFQQLGIDLTDTSAGYENLDTLLMAVMKNLGELSSVSDRTRLEMVLLGRGGRELGKAITEGADSFQAMRNQAHELGLVIDEQTLAAAERVGDQFDALITLLEVRGASIFLNHVELLAQLADQAFNAADALMAMVDAFRTLEERGSRNLLKTKADAIELENELTKILILMKKQGETRFLGTLPGGILSPSGVTLSELEELIRKQQAKVAEIDAIFERRAGGINPQGGAGTGLIGPKQEGGSRVLLPSRIDAQKEEKDRDTEQKKLLEDLKQQAAAEKATIEEIVRARLTAEKDEIALISEKRARRIEEIEATIKDEELKNAAIADADRAFEQEMLNQRTDVEEKIRKERDKTLKVERDSLDEFNDAFSDTMADLIGITDSSAKEMFQVFFKNFVLKALESWANIETLTGLGTAITGGVGTALTFAGSFFAKGGITTAPTVGILSESGQRESVLPFDIRDMNFGTNIVINNNSDSRVNARQRQAADGRTQTIIDIDAMVADSIARNGKTARQLESTFGLTRRGSRLG